MPFLPLYVEQLGVTGHSALNMWSGIVFSITFLFSAIASPFWGGLADRKGRKLMLLRSALGMGIVMVLMGLEVLNYLIPQLGTSTIELNFSAPSRDSVKEFISKIKQKGMEVHSYELKERRFSKEEFVEASIEIKAKRGFHTLEILDYMNDFSDVTISTIK